MGALEALNGMLLFVLTTAFLFAMIQKSGRWEAEDGPAMLRAASVWICCCRATTPFTSASFFCFCNALPAVWNWYAFWESVSQ
jgi:hypothetical protein